MMRAGRMLAQGDLRLLALALIAEQPRHGYEIIKVLEEKTEGWYAPSPGIVYPTLTYLEEAGYVTAQADGAKRLYTITAEGRAYLESNRAFVDAVLERLDAVGERMRSRRGDDDDEGRRGPRVPRLVRAALENLREVAAERLQGRRRCRGQGGRGAGARRGGIEEELARHDLGAADRQRGARRRRAAAAVDHRDFDLGRAAGRVTECARDVELIAAARRRVETRPTSTAEPPDGRSRTTAPSCPAGALRVTAMLISSMTTLELFADAGICTDMRAGDRRWRCRRRWRGWKAPRSTAPARAAAARRAARGAARNVVSASSAAGRVRGS